MAWIHQISDEEATGELDQIYAAARQRTGEVAHIIRVMSQRPSLLSTFMQFYLQLMQSETELTSREKELLATVTSASNRCFY